VPVISRAGLFQTKPIADSAEARSFNTTAMKNKRILGVGCIFNRALILPLMAEQINAHPFVPFGSTFKS
jgi:hypothetical protein